MLEVQPWMGRGIRCVGSRFTFGEHTCNMYAIHVLFNWMSVSGPEKGPNPLFENCCAPSAKLSNLRNGKLCSAGAMILPMSILSNSESEIDTVPPGATSSLRAAAFGDVPAHVPPWTASAPEEHWLRAVALGGQGRYSAARAELALVRRSASRGVWASLAESTEASFLRQLGWHRAAAVHDGRAWRQCQESTPVPPVPAVPT